MFLGNLRVTGKIYNSADGEGPIFLIVVGNCEAQNIFVDEPLLCIQGDLALENALWADYNHGVMRVRGGITAQIVLAEHEVWVSGTVNAKAVDFGGLRVRDESFVPTVGRDELAKAGDHLVSEVLKDGQLDTSALRARVEQGLPVFL